MPNIQLAGFPRPGKCPGKCHVLEMSWKCPGIQFVLGKSWKMICPGKCPGILVAPSTKTYIHFQMFKLIIYILTSHSNFITINFILTIQKMALAKNFIKTSVSQTVGRDPKVGREALPSGSPIFLGKLQIFVIQ